MSGVSFEWQSEAHVWIDHGGTVDGWDMPLKMTMSGVAESHTVLGAILQEHYKNACQLADGLRCLVAEPVDVPQPKLRSEKRAPTLLDIVRVLQITYKDEGVMIWLTAKNRHLPSLPDGNWTCSPQEYIAAGRTAEVFEAACRIEGFDPSDEIANREG